MFSAESQKGCHDWRASIVMTQPVLYTASQAGLASLWIPSQRGRQWLRQRLACYWITPGLSESDKEKQEFYILLTVHLRTNLVNNQLDAQILMHLFHFSTCFEQPRAHHLVCRSEGNILPTCTLDGHLHRVTHTRCCIATTDSLDDEHGVDRNM
jgi:hypothetical protein